MSYKHKLKPLKLAWNNINHFLHENDNVTQNGDSSESQKTSKIRPKTSLIAHSEHMFSKIQIKYYKTEQFTV